MSLQDDLERIAGAAARFVGAGEELAGILAAEPPRRDRAYLCAFRSAEGVTWLVLDHQGEPVTDREWVRQVVTLIALAELAEESAGGGELDELRSRLVALRLTENPPGIDEAEAPGRDAGRGGRVTFRRGHEARRGIRELPDPRRRVALQGGVAVTGPRPERVS